MELARRFSHPGVFIAESPSNNYAPMAYVGPVMSYYENITEDFKRLTDEEWTKNVQEGLLPSRPDWVNVYLANSEGNEFGEGRELDGVLYTGISQTINNYPDFGIDKVYPNPFSSSTIISYIVPSVESTSSRFGSSNIDLSVYNISGQKIETLVYARKSIGKHIFTWDSSHCQEGIYLLVFQTGEHQDIYKLIKTKD